MSANHNVPFASNVSSLCFERARSGFVVGVARNAATLFTSRKCEATCLTSNQPQIKVPLWFCRSTIFYSNFVEIGVFYTRCGIFFSDWRWIKWWVVFLLSSCALKCDICVAEATSWRACFCGRARSVTGRVFCAHFVAAARQQRACLSAHVFVARKLN